MPKKKKKFKTKKDVIKKEYQKLAEKIQKEKK